MDGAFTGFIAMPELFLHAIPDALSDEVAALTEPMAIAVTGALERGKACPGDTVVIVGAGPVALLSLVAVRAAGVKKVFVLGTGADEALRFPAAQSLGADRIINVMNTDAVAEIMADTDGMGADQVIEASGSAAGVNTAAEAVKKTGRITVLGLPGAEKIPVPWGGMVKKALDISFCFSSSVSSWEKAVSILSSSPYDLKLLISHRAKIDDWKKVFTDIEAGNAIKALFIPEKM
jgi:L-iditol 2-dehydrogenase